jgi:modulator of FtsH protease
MAEHNVRPVSQVAGAAPATPTSTRAIEINRVLRNTYLLLGMTLAWSAAVAGVTMALNVPHPGIIVTLVGFFGLLFLVHKTANSVWGLLSVFAFTGFLGFTLGPILNLYLGLSNGGTLVTSALATTAFAFVGLSAFALITRKDFSFLSGFLMVGFFVLMGAVLLSIFFDLSAFHTAISAGFVLFASAAILWQTSAIIHGGETNYLLATVTLYVSIYNLFLSLLQIFGVMGEDG